MDENPFPFVSVIFGGIFFFLIFNAKGDHLMLKATALLLLLILTPDEIRIIVFLSLQPDTWSKHYPDSTCAEMTEWRTQGWKENHGANKRSRNEISTFFSYLKRSYCLPVWEGFSDKKLSLSCVIDALPALFLSPGKPDCISWIEAQKNMSGGNTIPRLWLMQFVEKLAVSMITGLGVFMQGLESITLL